MKLVKFTVIVALIALVALYFWNREFIFKEKKIKPINQVSFQISNSDKNSAGENQTKPNIITEIELGELVVEDSMADITKKTDQNLDYVTAYRDWQYFANCYTDIEDFQNDREPLDTLAQRFANNPREAQDEPTAQQNSIYEQHVDICKTLIYDVGDDKDDYYQIMSNLENRFLSIEPKTKQAKQLEQALSLAKQLNQFKSEYINATYPVSNLSDVESNTINLRIEELSNNVIEIYESSDEITPEQALMISEISTEIENLRTELVQSRAINTENMTTKQQELDSFLNSMDTYLQQVQSPDAFLVITNELYNPEYFQKESTVLETMKAQTGIRDSYYIRILNRLVMPLVACSMNYPCGPQSDYMMSYCLGLRDSMFNQACGKNLTDFYFNFYIGMNQMQDVDNYFNYLLNRYAN